VENGRVVVVTGASAGVGRATAVAFARLGAKVGLLARGRAGLEGARQEVESAGGSAVVLQADVANAAAVDEAAARAERELGPIDVWVNNAMATVFAPVWQISAEEYRRSTEVTYLGAVYGTMAALRHMRERNAGSIVQVGSALAYRGIPLQSSYCGAKHALQGFTESVRTELLHERIGVRICMVQLPALNTPQFDWSRSRMPRKAQPVPPIFQPEVAAEAIVWAADHGRRELYVGWPTVKAITGDKVASPVLDHYLAHTGFDAQQTPEPMDGDRLGNLFEPLDEQADHGMHGRFDDRASPTSAMLGLSKHRRTVTAAATAGALAALSALRSGRGSR
jgi:NAD(P)-dependent dehydrogenase (short-subunit alcohol dehydrogenase family)